MLTEKQIRLLLDLLSEETVVAPTEAFPYRVSKRGFGYSKDPEIGALQAMLSIHLEVAERRGRGKEK